MTYLPPPPSPQNDRQQQQPAEQGFNIAGIDIKKIARAYIENRGLIKWGARLARQKIPPELDGFMEDLAYGRPVSEEKRQQFEGMARQSFGYEGQQIPREFPEQSGGYQVPPNVIGEPVMTRDLAITAWEMKKSGMNLRQIAEELTREGNPVSHSTVVRYINQIDEDIRFSQIARFKRLVKWGIAIGLWIGTVFLTHIFF